VPTTKKLQRVLVMAGGTGGHVFPGLAVADYLRQQGIEVHWLGTMAGLEARLVPEANIPFHTIAITGLRGKGKLALLKAPFKVIRAIKQAKQIINKINPDIVIGMGGFVSGPGGVASWLSGCPLVIHEQNAIAGLTNKLLARIAKRVLEGFPGAFKPQAKVVAVGNPVRADIEQLPPPEMRLAQHQQPFRLLVIGGSLGAQALNEIVPRAVVELRGEVSIDILHQTGDKHFEAAKKDYESMGIEATLYPFIKNMAQAYSWADVVVCRAGALTVAELCAVGLGAVFVPYPYAVDDHQTANAHFMVDHAAALCIQQADLTANSLAELLKQIAGAPGVSLTMAEAAHQLRKTNVAKKIFDILSEVVK
jgi:UDP-N-acetylglucosamine--N-acetylmuramyl-(pentapeptide) pyrophosphoryl-undecaprenol N-acetylglucosamine transferase